MVNKSINIEYLVTVMALVPLKTPWFYVLYAYIVSVLKKNSGNRVKTSQDIKMPMRTMRNRMNCMEVVGFDVPKSMGVVDGRMDNIA